MKPKIRTRQRHTFTLADEEMRLLKQMQDSAGLSMSALVGQAIRAMDAERTKEKRRDTN